MPMAQPGFSGVHYVMDTRLSQFTVQAFASGVISVVANEIPAEFSKLTKLALAGDLAGARGLQRQWFPLMEVNFCETNPGPVKAAMAMLGLLEPGLLEPVFRLPMVPPSEANRTKIETVLKSAGLLAAARSSHAD